MLVREIKYTNFNDEEVTETLMFNLSSVELVRLDAEYEGGLESYLNKITEERSPKGIMEFFEKVIKLAYGVKSEDGRTFIKNEELSESFMQSAAYDELFFELLSDETTAIDFFNALVPKKRIQQVKERSNYSRN